MNIDFSRVKDFNKKQYIRRKKKAYFLHKFLNFEIKNNFINDKRKFYREEYLQSEHWKNLRLKKLITKSCCEHCQSTLSLDVHHLDYKNLYDVELSDLQVLCRGCHILEHDNEQKRKIKKTVFVGDNRIDFFPIKGSSVGNLISINGIEQEVKDNRLSMKKLRKIKRLANEREQKSKSQIAQR